MHPASRFRRLENDAHPGVQGIGNAAQHTQGVAFVAGRLEPANLLLRGFEQFREVLLRKPGLLAEGGNLQRDIPRLARALKAVGKRRILQLLFEVTVEIGFFHCSALFRHLRIRSRAVLRSRAGTAWPLLRMPCTATIRRFFMKPQHAGIKLADVTQFKQPIAERLG
jgi:hypothetical protein